MPNPPLGSVLRHLRKLVGGAGGEESPDELLLERFASAREEAAFEELMARHGAMVYSVCRRVLDNDHDAADAYQATFLVLARKAGSIRKRASVGSWLYGVAYRVARKARVRAARLHTPEESVSPMCEADPSTPVIWNDLRGVLDEELNRLPAKYRDPLVLCYLEGQTHEQAARSLGWPSGTMSRRVGRGLEWLRERLVHRGVTMPSAALAALLVGASARAAAPAALRTATLQAAILFAQHAAVGTAGSGPALALAEGALRGFELARLRLLGVLVILLGLLGGVGLAYRSHLHDAAAVPAPNADELTDLDARLNELQPTPAERRIDEIGWAPDIRTGLKLAKEHNRPVFVFTHEGWIATGRCGGSAFHLRAGGLADDRVIAALNRWYVPVSCVNEEYRNGGSRSGEEKAELTRIYHTALNEKRYAGDDCLYFLAPNGTIVDTMSIKAAKNTDALLAKLAENARKLGTADGDPVVAPHPLSVRPAAPADALVLHVVSRIGHRKAWGNFPAEDWIVLPCERAERWVDHASTRIGSFWSIDWNVSGEVLRHFYPQSENTNAASNRIDDQQLRATVIAVDGDRVRARLDGELRMKHQFYPGKVDDNFVDATLVGVLEFDRASRRIQKLQLITETATYGQYSFTAGLRSEP